MAQATPSVTAAGHTGQPGARLSRARVRQISASSGGSVTPTASGNASTGDATANTPQYTAPGRPVTRWASTSSRQVTAHSQILGSPAIPSRSNAPGSPNTVMPGR